MTETSTSDFLSLRLNEIQALRYFPGSHGMSGISSCEHSGKDSLDICHRRCWSCQNIYHFCTYVGHSEL